MGEFAQVAAKLAGHAAVLFGWRPSEFWEATPIELAGVIGALTGEVADAVDRPALARLKEMFPDG